jgi:hypothetical protein
MVEKKNLSSNLIFIVDTYNRGTIFDIKSNNPKYLKWIILISSASDPQITKQTVNERDDQEVFKF